MPAIDAAHGKLVEDMAPVPDGAKRAAWAAAIDERLRRLAVKVAPHLSEEQGAGWRDAMVEALSDLPAMIVLTAAKRARHRPFRFIADIETAIREISNEMIEARRAQIARLEQIRADVERAARPDACLPPPVEEPITAEEIRAMSSPMRAMGVRLGALTEEQVANAMKEELAA